MTEKELMLLQLQQAFNKRSWHGTNLFGSLRGMLPEMAAWRPGPGRHNIWELILHSAYWKHRVTCNLTGDTQAKFSLKGSNFFTRPETASAKALKADIALLKTYHQELLDVVSAMKPSDLNKLTKTGKFQFRDLIIGVAAHDIYHAGQIQLLKRLYSEQS